MSVRNNPDAATDDEKRREAEAAWYRKQTDWAIARGVAARMRGKPVSVDSLPASPCDLRGDEFMVGPGGFTSVEYDGRWYVSEEQHLWTADFAYCAIERLERVLAEAERRGIDRKVMEEVMQHGKA